MTTEHPRSKPTLVESKIAQLVAERDALKAKVGRVLDVHASVKDAIGEMGQSGSSYSSGMYDALLGLDHDLDEALSDARAGHAATVWNRVMEARRTRKTVRVADLLEGIDP